MFISIEARSINLSRDKKSGLKLLQNLLQYQCGVMDIRCLGDSIEINDALYASIKTLITWSFLTRLPLNFAFYTLVLYCSLVLRDFAFIEHYFFDNIDILTKLSAKIWFKRLEPAYNKILP